MILLCFSLDEGGVFRAKKQNNAQGAHQVNDSRETRTEKPIDQREAEVVDEVRPYFGLSELRVKVQG